MTQRPTITAARAKTSQALPAPTADGGQSASAALSQANVKKASSHASLCASDIVVSSDVVALQGSSARQVPNRATSRRTAIFARARNIIPLRNRAMNRRDQETHCTADNEFVAPRPGAEKSPSASLAPSAARSTYREYASRAAFGAASHLGLLSDRQTFGIEPKSRSASQFRA